MPIMISLDTKEVALEFMQVQMMISVFEETAVAAGEKYWSGGRVW